MMRSNRKGRITVMNLLDHPVQLIVFLFLLSVLPLLVILGTSFLKISVVLALLRNALGIQQVPPNMALYAIALILTAYIMAPVGFQVSDALKNTRWISALRLLLRKSMTVCSRLTGVLSNSIRRRAKSGFLWRLDDAPGPNTTKSGSMRVLYGC